MSLIEKLRSSRDSYAVKLHNFVRIFTKSPSSRICFFEGEDVKYYGPRIEMINPELEWESIDCQGKNTALKLWTLINNHQLYSTAKTSFFFDADFDDKENLPDSNNIYITPCYSIENLYASESVVKKILRAEFSLCEKPDDDNYFARCFELFKARLFDFLEVVQLVNAWILFHRKRESHDSSIKPLNLASLKMNRMFIINLDSVSRTYTISDLQNATGNFEPVSEAELQILSHDFDQSKRHLQFRGKFQAYFMRIFLTLLKIDAISDSPVNFPSKRNVPLQISDRNFLSDLSQFADTPFCLRMFIASLN